MSAWGKSFCGKSFSKPILRAAILLATLAISMTASAQQFVSANVANAMIEPAPAIQPPLPEAPRSHRFWDTQNTLLFVGVAAVNSADFAVTRQNLQSGGQELNPITRLFAGSSAGLAFNFAGETAGTMAIAYLFHRTGHHRLERMTSAVAMSISAPAVIYSGTHR
jgi:hypothetical protein